MSVAFVFQIIYTVRTVDTGCGPGWLHIVRDGPAEGTKTCLSQSVSGCDERVSAVLHTTCPVQGMVVGQKFAPS